MSRIEALKGFLEEDPNDSFSRYALAMEHIKLGDHDRGISEFKIIVERDPSYVATYYQLGKTYEREGRAGEALQTYNSGIEVAIKAGDGHTRDELREALTMLEGTL